MLLTVISVSEIIMFNGISPSGALVGSDLRLPVHQAGSRSTARFSKWKALAQGVKEVKLQNTHAG